jgi:signal transduction histidine kinase
MPTFQAVRQRVTELWGMGSERALHWGREQLAVSRRSLWAMIAIVAAIVVINGCIFLNSVQGLNAREQAVQHSQHVQNALQGLLTTLDDAETGQRGYLLTDDQSYLKPYNTAQATIDADLAQLKGLLRDNPPQEAQLTNLTNIVGQKMAELRQSVQMQQNGDNVGALQLIRSNTGQQLMDQIRTSITSMETQEHQTFLARTAAAKQSLEGITVTFVIGTLALLGMLGLISMLIQQMMQQREDVLATESAAREHAEAAVRLRDDFLSIASHELKTPITAISTSAQLMERQLLRLSQPNDRLTQLVDVQLRQTKRLKLLIEGMLDVSRIGTGHFAVNRAPFDVVAQIRPIVNELAVSDAEHTLTLHAPPTLTLDADEARLEQVWYNLLQNAIKYSPEGGAVRINVTAEGDNARIIISDQGIGIPANAMGHLFEAYYRAPNTDTPERKIKGIGVGLFVTRQIVIAHGGTITAESEEGEGTTFTIELPIHAQGEAEYLIPTEATPAASL